MKIPTPDIWDLEQGDRIVLKAGKYHRDDWLGPREFTITVVSLYRTNNFGLVLRSHEEIDNGEDDACSTWYLEDGWILETEDGVEIDR